MVARLVRPDELPSAARCLASAFANDPVFMWIFSDAPKRPLLTQFFMEGAVEASSSTGTCYVTSELDAAAVWAAPGKAGMSGDIWNRTRAMMFGAEGARMRVIGEFFGQLADFHPAEPHWYLSLVGAETPGIGAGARVLEPVLEICDRTGDPAYLESSNPRNIAFYERLGFTAVGEVRAEDGPLMVPMVRNP
jgi:RimJ/RimL family protein N-acetyltransferase